ncbi:Uma2 family endonuclease [Nonomuraea typhae]|uniref:Uma2 family endonuclease n=1 Tax=Nonomuraea typhae TaxID=2603600 RepID=UPI0012FB22A3|nr:Uma2 family endonuclease [Nonomuraea typhae]
MATIEPTATETALPGDTVLPGKPPFTVDDLLEFPDDGNRYELINGSLLVSPAPSPLHQLAIFQMQRLLYEAAPPGLQPLSTVNLRISERTFFIPDIAVVPVRRLRSVELMFAPSDILLAVEIVSPTTRVRDRLVKAAAYAEAGITTYWRVELDEGPALYAYTLGTTGYGDPQVHRAGQVAAFQAPFEVAFDPGVLVEALDE